MAENCGGKGPGGKFFPVLLCLEYTRRRYVLLGVIATPGKLQWQWQLQLALLSQFEQIICDLKQNKKKKYKKN